MYCVCFFFKQKTAYEMRISDWSSDVCSSDLTPCPWMLKRVQHDGRVVTDFTRFAAIDWSGAKGRRHKGIAIAACGPGDAPPELIAPGHVWSRREDRKSVV